MSLRAAARFAGIYYGWYIVAVALIAQFVATGTQAYAAGVFLKPMSLDLGWTRQEFSAVLRYRPSSWEPSAWPSAPSSTAGAHGA